MRKKKRRRRKRRKQKNNNNYNVNGVCNSTTCLKGSLTTSLGILSLSAVDADKDSSDEEE